MKLSNLISPEIPELSLKDNVVNALNLMEEYHVSHLPVISEGKYIGLADKETLLDVENPVKSSITELLDVFISPNQHINDVVKIFSTQDLSILPIKDEDNVYVGSITLETMVDTIAERQSVHEPGGILVFEMEPRDYSMQQIAGIVESNDSKILSSSTHSDEETGKLNVTIKVNTMEIGGILQTFERYGYRVKSSYQEHDYSKDLLNQYEEFMKYMNM